MPHPSVSRTARPRAVKRRWRVLTVSTAAVLVAASLATAANADPVTAGPVVPDELAVLAIGGALPTPASYRTDQVAVHRLSTATGAYAGRILFPAAGDTPLTVSTQSANTPIRNRTLRRSVDGRYLTFTGIKAASGLNYQDAANSAAVRIAADGAWTDTPFGAGYITSIGQESVGAVTVDGSRFWTGTTTSKPLATIAPGDAALTQVAAQLSGSQLTSVEIVDGALYATSGAGVFRVPGALPTTASTTTALQSVIPLTESFDSAFVDTDAVAGVDTAYVTRGNRGLWKFALVGGTWTSRGHVSGSFGWVAARAVAGAVELYASSYTNTKVQKVVDTAQVGAEIATGGVTTLAFAPSGARYAGLTFAPGSGFPSDATPYPATPPAIYPSATTVDTALQSAPKASLTLDVVDPNSPASDLTVTASSSNATVLPNDRIVINGTGTRRTVTFDPQDVGSANVTLTVLAPGDTPASVTIAVKASAPAPDPTSHYYSGAVDLSASLDVGGDYFLSISDEVNNPLLYKKGVSGPPIASFPAGFPGGETDFEGVTRFGDTVVWSGSHGNNRSGSNRPERRFLAFEKITGSGDGVDLEFKNSYTRLWAQWKAWDAANGHGLGANKLKFNTATVPGLIPNAPNGFNVEGLTMAPGSQTTAWFGMRAPTITGDDGIERALILPVTNIDKLTSDAVDATFGAPILLDLGGRSIRDISKNAADQYLIEAGTGDTDDSLKNWALYTWDGDPSHDPKFVNELANDAARIGAWEGIAEVPNPLVAGSKALLTADSGDTGLGKSYGQYVTIGEPVPGPAVVSGVTAIGKPGALDIAWDAAPRADRYYVTVKTPAGAQASGSPFFVTGTTRTLEGLTAGTEYTVNVRAENVATRSASGTAVKATPIQGARTATTTSVRFEGSNVIGQPQKLYATVSEPGAVGTVQFLENGSAIRAPGNVYDFPVVDGKVELDVTDRFSPGIVNLQAKFTTANAENFTSSDSPVVSQFLDYKPLVPRAEIVSITGDRVVGGRITIKAKLHGFTPAQLYTAGQLAVEFGTRLNGATIREGITGDDVNSQYGSVYFNAQGEATFSTTTLAAGKHRIGGWVPNFSLGYAEAHTDDVPVTIAPAGSPAVEAPAISKPRVAVTISGPRRTNQPLTLTARVSDKTLAGTVQFFYGRDNNIGTPVPVVDGVASYTGNVPNAIGTVFARFEPAANRDTTASATSLGVPYLRGTTADLPLLPATPTTTTLEVTGDRVVGSPLTATIAVTPASTAPFGARDVNGYVEVLDNGTASGLVPVVAGKAVVELGALPAGTHSLTARYVTSDETRSESSSSAAQVVAVFATTNTDTNVGGSVPATLALSLGAPASFGSFVPGMAHDYDASMTATVVSTAGDAALTVADTSATAPGHLVNGAFSLPQALQAKAGTNPFAPVGATPTTLKTYAGPVSNDRVAVDFRQSIGANDAVRTGQYGKTLTLTLSTTTP